MAEKTPPMRIRVWQNEPNGEFVASFPGDLYIDENTEYVRADSHDKLAEALKEARTFIEAEYRDPSAEPDGEWLAKDARPVHALICAALASLDQESGQ